MKVATCYHNLCSSIRVLLILKIIATTDCLVTFCNIIIRGEVIHKNFVMIRQTTNMLCFLEVYKLA